MQKTALFNRTMNIIYLDTIDSTNSYAKSKISVLSDKTVIAANHQTAGRGRFDRKWVDLGDDNIFLTIVLKPSTEFSNIFSNFTQYMSVVLCKILETYKLRPEIKWPNDVLIGNAKIAGILAESVIRNGKFYGIVLGIGVNLNSNINNLSLITDKKVSAVNILLNVNNINKDLFLEKFLKEFFTNYEDFFSAGFKFIMDDYISRCSFLGKNIVVKFCGQDVTGKALGIDDTGKLVILRDDNTIQYICAGDIIL